ncbi:MAG: hypothetical protein ACRD0Q_12075 [Acidimicrobiales bacterium]
MSDQFLELLSYLALAIGIGLVLFQLSVPHLPRQVRVLRFRRRMHHNLDSVITRWAVEMRAKSDPTDDMVRRPRRPQPGPDAS